MLSIFPVVIPRLQFNLIIGASKWRQTLQLKFGIMNIFALVGENVCGYCESELTNLSAKLNSILFLSFGAQKNAKCKSIFKFCVSSVCQHFF